MLIAISMPRSAQDIARLGTRFAYSIFCAMTECDNRGGLPTREDPPVILVLSPFYQTNGIIWHLSLKINREGISA